MGPEGNSRRSSQRTQKTRTLIVGARSQATEAGIWGQKASPLDQWVQAAAPRKGPGWQSLENVLRMINVPICPLLELEH